MTGPGEPRLLHDFFDLSVGRRAGRVAIEVPPGTGRPARRTVTYGELDRRAAAIAARVAGPDDAERLVAILLPRHEPDAYAAQLGALRAGAAYLCIDPAFPDGHARAILEEAGGPVLVTDAAGAARAAAAGFPAERIEDVGRIPPAAAPGQPRPLAPSRLAYVIYTSGTTGQPKGVMVEHRSIANLVADDLATFRLAPEDRVAQASSLAYDSSIEETWLAFAAGATLVPMDDEAARLGPDLVPWLHRERITVFCPPPTLLRTMSCADPASALPHVRVVYVGGEALPADLADLWARGRRMENGYGPTECAVTATRATVRPGEPVSIGRPVAGNRAWILDDDLREVADGEAGELCIGGVGLARGYRNRPELTAERFPEHPRLGRIYRTGDLARRDAGGNLHYLGRIDAQVKLRGYRIELPAIEAKLALCDGVREAACRVQGNALVAFVVPERADAPPDLAGLEASLRRALPAYMVPSRFGVLPRLPTTVGGKLDRLALPELDAPARADAAAPRDGTERRIAAAVAAAVGGRDVSREDDFFLDLGGDSLAAADVVSALRQDLPLAVRDIYEARTVAALAERARAAARPAEEAAPPGPRPDPLGATLLQCAVLLAGLVAGAALSYAIAFHVLPFLLRGLGIPAFLLLLPAVAFVAALLWAPLAVTIAARAKRVLIGTYRAGRAPVWGGLFVRNWIVQRTVRIVPWGLLQGTVFQSAALRALGARIGRRVHIHRGVDVLAGGWDLLAVGDDVTVSRDAALRVVELDRGEIVFGPVAIGDRSTIDVRAGLSGGTAVGRDAYVGPLSWLAPGSRVGDGERWDGVPAGRTGDAPAATPADTGRALPPARHGALMILARFLAAYVAALPLVGLLLLLASAYRVDAEKVLAWLLAPSFAGADLSPVLLAIVAAVPLGLAAQALGLRALGPVRPGHVDRWSAAYVRIWLKAAVLESAGRWLSGTVFWPSWLRLAGMRVGRSCEVSTIIDTIPELVEIGDTSFLADGIYLAGPRVHRGVATVLPTKLGRETFLGNHVVVPVGQRLPDRLFVGVCTVTDEGLARPGSSWFGHPAFELPRRAVVEADRTLTHDPAPVRRLTRWTLEAARALLPVPALLILLGWFKALATAAGATGEAAFWLAGAPVATLAAAATSCLLVLALKWFLLGRVRPGQHPLWSCWCSRWDFLYVAWGYLARGILSSLEGTLLLPWYLRAMGARVGRRVVLGGAFAQVVDPDMLQFDDGATVAGMFQAHSFEDRVLKIDRVRIRADATLGAAAVLFYGADVGARAHVAPGSVVMKNERLAAHRRYAGCPTRQL